MSIIWVAFKEYENIFAGTVEKVIQFCPFDPYEGHFKEVGESPFEGEAEMFEKLAKAKKQAEARGGRLCLSNLGRSQVNGELAEKIDDILELVPGW